MKEKILRIVNHYGLINQLKKLNEEVYELIEAETEAYYTLNTTNYEKLIDHILEEYADVLHVLEQHRLYWELSLEDVKEILKYKVERTNKGIDEELLRSTEGTGDSKS